VISRKFALFVEENFMFFTLGWVYVDKKRKKFFCRYNCFRIGFKATKEYVKKDKCERK
jgi:hypothetical protein